MLRRAPWFALVPLVAVVGCRLSARPPVEQIARDNGAMPKNTVALSQMMRELSAKPGFTEALLAQLNKGGKEGSALLTPELFDLFRKMVLGSDWSGLDRFPGWTIHRVTRTVKVGEHIFTQPTKPTRQAVTQYLNVGNYLLDAEGNENLDLPSDRGGLNPDISMLSDEVQRGDGPDPKLAPLHAESACLAELLNRLAINGDGIAPYTASIGGQTASSPEQLIAALTATGHSVTVADARFFANFGHFHYKGQDVEMPFWMDSQLLVPAEHWWQRSRHLLVPVAHAEYEWIITGPKINADVTFYYGIDGHAEFRTNDALNQPWVMGRHAHEYRDKDALEVTRLVTKFIRAYSVLHAEHSDLPFGGYYTLGVCQDSVGAIEKHMTGQTTLFPNTAKTEYFHDQPDSEITALMEAVPKDDGGVAPTPERIFGSLPTTDYNSITVPGLRQDIVRTHDAWQRGHLHHAMPWQRRTFSYLGILIATGVSWWLIASGRPKRKLR